MNWSPSCCIIEYRSTVRILTCLVFCASGKLSSEHDLHDGRQGNIGLCSWQSLLRHSPRPTQRRAIITRHGNNQLVKQEEAARCAPMCGERELEDVWRLRKKQQAGVSIYYSQEEPFWGWIMSCESCPLCLNETEIYIYIFNMKSCIQKTLFINL